MLVVCVFLVCVPPVVRSRAYLPLVLPPVVGSRAYFPFTPSMTNLLVSRLRKRKVVKVPRKRVKKSLKRKPFQYRWDQLRSNETSIALLAMQFSGRGAARARRGAVEVWPIVEKRGIPMRRQRWLATTDS